MLIEQIVDKNAVLQNLVNHILCEQRFEEDRFKFKHCCPDILSRLTIGDMKSSPFTKCQCSILELFLRYIVAFNAEVQEKIKNFFISLFNLYHWKQNLIKGYTKMFNFFFYYKENVDNKESHPFISTFVDINVQLFTSDILSGYVLDQKTESYIVEYFMQQNTNKLNLRKKSLDVTNEVLESKNKRKNSESSHHPRKQSDNQPPRKISLKNETNQSTEQNITTQSTATNENQTNRTEEIQEESKNQENEIIFEEVEVFRPPNMELERDDDFETEEEEGEGDEEYEEYDDDEEEEDESDNSDQPYNDFYDEQIDESLPLFDDASEAKSEINKIQSQVNEYYFGNILDKLLFFASYSFKQTSVVDQFFRTFYHLKYISQKEFSLNKLIEKQLFRVKFIELFYKMQEKIDFKLRRKIATLYDKDQFFFNAAQIEKQMLSILRKIVAYLHTNKSVDQHTFQKVHIDYMKLIIQKIYEYTEKYHPKNTENDKYRANDTNTIYIPLHRALILFILSYFKFDFEKMNPQSLTSLARSLNLEYEEFKTFFIEQVRYPLNVIALVKEIDSGVWNFHGEEFKYTSVVYTNQELSFYTYDTLFFQFVLKMGYTDLSYLSSIFSTKKEFHHIVQASLATNKKKDEQDFLEKNEKVVGQFFSFVVYALLDSVSLFNLIQSVFHTTTDHINPYLKHSNQFIASYMHQFKAASVQEVQESLIKTFGRYYDVSTLLMQVCSFNNSNKKFTLLDKFSDICEPNLFFWSPIIKSAYHDKIFQRYQNSKDLHLQLLGNAVLNNVQKAQLKNVINQSSFSFIEDLVRQPFISSQLQSKKSIAQQYLIGPILKLILLFTQNRSSYQNGNAIETHANKILTFLVQFKDNYSKEVNDSIQLLQEKLAKSDQQLTLTKSQSSHDDDQEAAKKKKQLIQQKQQEILKLFQQRSQSYSEKNKEELVLEKSTSEGDSCVICKKQIDDEAEYGFGILCQKTNIYEFSELRGFIQQTLPESEWKDMIKFEALKNNYWNIKEGNWQINSCFHHIHKDCYQQYLYTKNKQNANNNIQHEYKCPLCNKPLNSFLSIVSNQFPATLTEDFNMLSNKSDNKKSTLVNWCTLKEDSSNTCSKSNGKGDEEKKKKSQEQNFKTHEIQQQIISEYETMNKKRKCEITATAADSSSTDAAGDSMCDEIKFKKIQINQEKGKLIDFDFLSNQLVMINLAQFENDTTTKGKDDQMELEVNSDSADDKAMTRMENIILNQLRLTDFECTPTALIEQKKKLDLLRQVLYNFNLTLLSQKQLKNFYRKRYNYCKNVLALLTNIEISDIEGASSSLNNNLMENDLKEMYMKFLFYNLNYFNEQHEVITIIQKTINQILLAKFVQIHTLFLKKKTPSENNRPQQIEIKDISTFEDNERCQYNVDILQRTWNLLSVFFDFEFEVQQNLNTIFSDSQDEVSNLLKFMKVNVLSKDDQNKFLEKCIQHEFNQNHVNIHKITPGNTSFNFASLEYKFDDLFKKYQCSKCAKCQDISKYRDANLTMCLICGEILCSITCGSYEELDLKNHMGNLHRHACEMHCNSSLYLDLSSSMVIQISTPHNSPGNELYANSFGIPFKKSAKDWSLFQLDNAYLSKLHQIVTNLSIIDSIKLKEVTINMLYRQKFY